MGLFSVLHRTGSWLAASLANKYIAMLPKWMIVICAVAMLPAVAMGQQDPQAKQILDAMRSRYAQVSTIRADLVQNIFNAEEPNEVISGSMAVKGDKYVLRMGPQEIANDGQKVYLYSAPDNELTIDYYYPAEGELSPTGIFDLYLTAHDYQYVGVEAVQGASCYVVDLIPTERDVQFFRIRLFIRGKDFALLRYQLFDHTGTHYTFDLRNLRFDLPVQDAEFVFSSRSHPGAAVVDFTN